MRGSRKCATTDLRSLPVGIMAFASASVQYVLIVVNQSAILLRVFSAGRPEGSVLVRFVSAYRVERNMSPDHQPMFQPVSSRVRIIERVLFNMVAFRPLSRSQLRAEISGNDCGVFGAVAVRFNAWVHLFDVYVRESQFADASVPWQSFAVMSFLLHLQFNKIPTPCF